MSTQQQQSSILTGSFSLIWYYWYKKYMLKKTKKTINKETKIKEKRNKGKVSNFKKKEKKKE